MEAPDLSNLTLKKLSDVVKQRNARLITHKLPTWMRNYRENAMVFEAVKGNVPNSPHLNMNLFDAFEERFKGRDILVIGSGPSLNHALTRLHRIKRHEYVVFASPTNVSALKAFGFEPDFIMVSDTSPVQRSFLDLAPCTAPIFISPMTSVDVMMFPGPTKYLFLQYLQDEKGGVQHWWNFVSAAMFPEIPEFLVQAGCVTNQILILINAAINKGLLNPKRIILLGADYSFPEKTSFRVRKYKMTVPPSGRATYQRIKDDSQNVLPDSATLLKINNILTNIQMAHYKVSLMILWKELKLPLFRSFDHGILSEIPYIEDRNFIMGNLPEPYDPEYAVEQVRGYFASEDIKEHVK